MKTRELVSLTSAAALLLALAGCDRVAPIPVPGDTDGDSDSDTDGDSDSDTDGDTDLIPCIYECIPSGWSCGNRGSAVHYEMSCPDPEEICCDYYKKFEDSWQCLICTDPYSTGAGPHDLRD